MSATTLSTDELDMLRDAARSFAQRELRPGAQRQRRGQNPPFDPATWQAMAAMGWTGLLIDEAHGGAGAGLQAFCTVLSELGRALPAEPLVACGVLATVVVQGSDNAALRGPLLSGIAAGHELPSLAMEPTARGTGGVRAQRQAGGRWRLSGELRFARPGHGATGHLVLAETAQGSAVFWLRAGVAGLSTAHEMLTDGSDAARLTLSDVALGDTELLLPPGHASAVVQRAVDAALIATAAELLGLMRGVFEQALDYLRTRRQFGVAIGSFQALQHRAVDLHIQHELTSALVERASRLFDEGSAETSQVAAHAKARAADAAQQTVREAMQFHGAMGYTDECDIGLFLKRSLSLAAWLGNPSEQRRRYARLRFSPAASNTTAA
ncbi:acyl-CoA dehydrogenase family protein [Hydrogenophaga sp. BPS33]|uniref:acyl-CoA dehydrogenase family protein n=1 Tax=Hydrogenophaga sp. BPS33 TaxID=2651974 RepID=UPI00131F829F|nr:acyl-CoA dehydrogenase family protein [Hydrogenophaga sp. BPS33]QHE83941.1 acyl-CoA dehydrogenase [Hydrogenophaga sp. BPS33]